MYTKLIPNNAYKIQTQSLKIHTKNSKRTSFHNPCNINQL